MLEDNFFGGSVPSFLANLTSLRKLIVSGSHLVDVSAVASFPGAAAGDLSVYDFSENDLDATKLSPSASEGRFCSYCLSRVSSNSPDLSCSLSSVTDQRVAFPPECTLGDGRSLANSPTLCKTVRPLFCDTAGMGCPKEKCDSSLDDCALNDSECYRNILDAMPGASGDAKEVTKEDCECKACASDNDKLCDAARSMSACTATPACFLDCEPLEFKIQTRVCRCDSWNAAAGGDCATLGTTFHDCLDAPSKFQCGWKCGFQQLNTSSAKKEQDADQEQDACRCEDNHAQPSWKPPASLPSDSCCKSFATRDRCPNNEVTPECGNGLVEFGETCECLSGKECTCCSQCKLKPDALCTNSAPDAVDAIIKDAAGKRVPRQQGRCFWTCLQEDDRKPGEDDRKPGEDDRKPVDTTSEGCNSGAKNS